MRWEFLNGNGGAMSITSDWSFDWGPTFNRSNTKTATSQFKMRSAFVHPTDQQLELSDLTRTLTAYGWPSLAVWSGMRGDGNLGRSKRQEAGPSRLESA